MKSAQGVPAMPLDDLPAARATAGRITMMLRSGGAADPAVIGAMFTALHRHIHQIARCAMPRRGAARTLQTTVLVNQAYVNLVDRRQRNFEGTAHFLATVAKTMHNLVIDYIRTRTRGKRHGSHRTEPFSELVHGYQRNAIDVVALRDSLKKLERRSPRQSRIVQLRFFGGLSFPEIAGIMRRDVTTVERDWRFARAWLHAELS